MVFPPCEGRQLVTGDEPYLGFRGASPESRRHLFSASIDVFSRLCD